MDNSAPSGNNKHIKEFPAIDNKLHALTKKSLFEKQRAEAEAKRVREEAETKAVYESFVKSFDDDEGDANPYANDGGGYGRGGGGGGGGYGRGGGGGGGGYTRGQQGGYDRGGRRFGGPPPPPPMRGSMSGPGSLGPIPAPPRKRGFEASFNNNNTTSRRNIGGDRGAPSSLLNFDDSPPRAAPRGFGASDDEGEDDTASGRAGGRATGGRAEPALAKPTLRLAQLPPGTSTAAIKALVPGLTVDAVKILPPPPGMAGGERRSMTAIVTLSQETAANDIDAAVHALQNKYLGFGFCLELHRHLSSAALESSTAVGAGAGRGSGSVAGAAAHPFGAKPVVVEGPGPNTQQFAPNQYRGIAPPTSYASTPRGPIGPILHVPVRPPSDIKELRVIHKTIESLLTHGPAFEALLMSRPEVQREPRWAWLWDARSAGGVYYRYRLWEMMTSSTPSSGRYVPLFEDSAAWKAPESALPFEFVTRLDEFVEDAAYNSDDDDEGDSGDEAGRGKEEEGGPSYLNPLARAKLTHLLARLPTTTGKLRKGDVARVTAFAITHAGRGADEVVEALVANVLHPYSFTSANPSYQPPSAGGQEAGDKEKEDTTPATLNGLHLISSLLSSCSTSRIRHAWRYRSLIESALRRSKTFEHLAGLERRMGWGRMRGEKWRRSVGAVLSLWEGWCVFPAKAQEGFVEAFKVPVREEKEVEEKKGGRWKAVEKVVSAETTGGEEDVDGEPMVEDEDEDLDGVPMEPSDEEGDVDGEPMVVDEEERYEPPPAEPVALAEQPQTQEREVEKPVRKRPKAEDMFADSGSEGE